MTHLIFNCLTIVFVFYHCNGIAQNLGVNSTGATPHASAILDVDASPSNNRGFLMPRMTTIQRLAITSPANGLQVFDTNLGGYYYFSTITNNWDCVSNPAGTVQYFANAVAPLGYLACDGTSHLTTQYPELFNAIGYLYGGAGSNFNVPDLRGEFVRGLDAARGVDAGRGIGTWQVATAFLGDGDGINMPHPNLNDATQQSILGFETDAFPANGTAVNLNYGSASTGNCNITGVHSDGAASTCIDFARSRPRNVALLPCIKY